MRREPHLYGTKIMAIVNIGGGYYNVYLQGFRPFLVNGGLNWPIAYVNVNAPNVIRTRPRRTGVPVGVLERLGVPGGIRERVRARMPGTPNRSNRR